MRTRKRALSFAAILCLTISGCQHSIPINSKLTLAGTAWGGVEFHVPRLAVNVSIQGHFTASGEGDNNIEVYVLSESDLLSFKNGHPAHTFYSSGRMATGTISAKLPNSPGTYYLAFDNRFTAVTPKYVTVTATLNYRK